MAYNFTSQPVASWRESLSYGGNFIAGKFNLGLDFGPEKTAETIREKLGEINPSFLISEVHLHNEGDYENGKRDKLSEREYYEIHEILRTKKPKIHFRPEVFLIPSS